MAAQVLPIIGLVMAVLGFLGSFIKPLGNFVDQSTLYLWKNSIPDLGVLLDADALNRLSSDEFKKSMYKYGFSEKWINNLQSYAKRYLGLNEYLTLFRRGEISENEYLIYMSKLGFSEHDSKMFQKSQEFYPSPIDLVRFAVREVYSPEIAERFQLFEDMPSKFLTESEKVGLPQEQAKNFWAAHWELPSPQMGFEMFHRGIIGQSDLQLLLRSLDIMPFWREKLTELSYNPLTRVDVRRMYSIGILDSERVYKSYLDIGYSPENAEAMTRFTIEYENDEVTGLTRATVINAYKDSIISKDQLQAYLSNFRYNEDVVSFWLEVADYEKTQDSIKKYTDDLVSLYRLGSLNIEQIKEKLLAEDLPSIYIDSVISDTLKLKASKVKVPSKEDIERWLRNGIVDEDYYVDKMRLLGYEDNDIEIFLSEIALTIDTKGRKFLDVNIYSRWLTSGIITKERYVNILTDMGINEGDIDKLLVELEVK